MLKFAPGGCGSEQGSREQTMPEYGGTLLDTLPEADCKSRQAPTSKMSKRRGLGGYADAKVRFRGLCLRQQGS